MLHFPDRLSANNRRLGHLLVRQGYLSETQLLFALEQQHHHPQPLGQLLQHLGWVRRNTLKRVLRQQQRLQVTAAIIATLLPTKPTLQRPSHLPILELPEFNCWLTTQLSHEHSCSELRVEELTLLSSDHRNCAFFCLRDHRGHALMLRTPVSHFIKKKLSSGLADQWAQIILGVKLDGERLALPVLLRPQKNGEQALPRLCLAARQLGKIAPNLSAVVNN